MDTQKMETSFGKVKLSPAYKGYGDHNPVMTQRFGADPYAIVYNGRVYLYMTGDDYIYDASGNIVENNYSNINTINVISSDDLVNWTDHGSVYAASETGAANWGANSWAPAAAYKNIDGKDKFFLYFANNGNGIAVLSADSPVGPFTDPINGPLISRKTPNCAEVTWLFDPAVLMDDDGEAYLYVGGGVPSPDKASNPGTARMVKLGKDMISLDGDPQPIENVAYLFEDSGINKIGDKYYYSYCSNFSMTPEAEKELGYNQGEIVTMVSDKPLGPFKPYEPVLKNPQYFFGLGGNNHHCMFEFNGEWYITYHARTLEKEIGGSSGYRSTHIDKLNLNSDGGPTASVGTKEGVAQIKAFNPYEKVSAVTMANSSGLTTTQFGETAKKYGSGDMIVTDIHDGAWIQVTGVDFGEKKPLALEITVRGKGKGAVKVSLNAPENEAIAYVEVDAPGDEFTALKAGYLGSVTGKHDLFFTFLGEDYEVESWRFKK